MGKRRNIKLSRKQRIALQETLAFTDEGFNPTEKAVELFFLRTDQGKKIPWNNNQDYFDYCELLIGHNLKSGMQRELWLEGHFNEDYSLGFVVQDFLKEINNEKWFRYLPAYIQAYQLHHFINEN